MSSYKLVQHLRNYINPKGIQDISLVLNKDVKKDVFIDGHERPDVVEDREQFLKTMKELELFLVEFKEDGTMKAKNYPSDCKVGGN